MKTNFGILFEWSLKTVLLYIKFLTIMYMYTWKPGKIMYANYTNILFVKARSNSTLILFDFLLAVKAAPHECVITTRQP